MPLFFLRKALLKFLRKLACTKPSKTQLQVHLEIGDLEDEALPN